MDLNTPESAEMAEQAFKKREVAEQKLGASLKCVIDMMVMQDSKGSPTEAGQTAGEAWNTFEDAHWDFLEMMEEEMAESEEVESSYLVLMNNAIIISCPTRSASELKGLYEEALGSMRVLSNLLRRQLAAAIVKVEELDSKEEALKGNPFVELFPSRKEAAAH